MWPDRVSNPGPLTYESGALPPALRGPAVTSPVNCMQNVKLTPSDVQESHSRFLGKPRIRLNNLKTSLRFPCLGLNPIIESINLQRMLLIDSICPLNSSEAF